MKEFVNIRNHSDDERLMFHGVCHLMLLYVVFSRLSDIEEFKDDIEKCKIKTASIKFSGFAFSKEVIVKEIIRECFAFGWWVGEIMITPQPKKLWSM